MPAATAPTDAAGAALLVTPRVAAQLLSISERTLWALSHPRGALPVVRLPGTRAVRYSVAALQAFIAAAQEGGRPGVEAKLHDPEIIRRERGDRP
jgi:hypothetical protein